MQAEALKRAQTRRGEIPVAPLRPHIQRWLDSHGYDHAESHYLKESGAVSPVRLLVEVVWPDANWENGAKTLRLLMTTTEVVSFDLADKIICTVLGEPDLWIGDPELAEAYESVDFRSLDATRPTCETVADRIIERVVSIFRDTGSLRAVERETGIAIGRVKAILEAQQELACA